MVTTVDLQYAYPQGPSFAFPDIDLVPGAHLLIVGASGIGKTTLLHLLSGLIPPSNGRIQIGGQEITQLDRKALDMFRGRHIGIVFQQYQFIQSLTVEENLRLRQYFPGRSKDGNRRMELAERLGLQEILGKHVTELSQGQRQRLAIAQGVIHRPKVVFADEPTSNLDDFNSAQVIGLLKEEAERGGSSLVIITHDQRVKEHFSNQIAL